MSDVVLLRSSAAGPHITLRIFVGPELGRLVLAGVLLFQRTSERGTWLALLRSIAANGRDAGLQEVIVEHDATTAVWANSGAGLAPHEWLRLRQTTRTPEEPPPAPRPDPPDVVAPPSSPRMYWAHGTASATEGEA